MWPKLGRRLSRQMGIAVAQGLMASAMLGSASMVGVDWALKESADAVERSQASFFVILDGAVGSYLGHYHDQLVASNASGGPLLPPECANSALGYMPTNGMRPVPGSLPADPDVCRMTLTLAPAVPATPTTEAIPAQTITLKNALQPTVAELKKIGVLMGDFSSTPIMPSSSIGARTYFWDPTIPNGGYWSTATPAHGKEGYSIFLLPRCIGLGTTPPARCPLANRAYTTLTINTQPFERSQSSSQNFSIMLDAAGGSAAISGPEENQLDPSKLLNPTGELRAKGRGWAIENPVMSKLSFSADVGSPSVDYMRGADGILGMRNGYDATVAQEYTRRDGSSPPTADWDFNGKNLSNVKDLRVTGDITGRDGHFSRNVTAEGKLYTPTIAGYNGGNVTVENTLNTRTVNVSETLTVTQALNALSNIFVDGFTTLRGGLSVAGAATFNGLVTFTQAITGTSAVFSGNVTADSMNVTNQLQAGSLRIGNTQITANGTLLGTDATWGVTPGAACSLRYALAQAADTGALMICKSTGREANTWMPVGAQSSVSAVSSGASGGSAIGQPCTTNGALGQLSDGTLVTCQSGTWQSALQSVATSGGACSVRGTLATTFITDRAIGSHAASFTLLVCNGSTWTDAILARPQARYSTQGESCGVDGEIALDGKVAPDGRTDATHPVVNTCVAGVWQNTTAAKVVPTSGHFLTTACAVNGTMGFDENGTSPIVCKDGIWSLPTTAKYPARAGDACTLADSTRIKTVNDKYLWCNEGHFESYPMTIKVLRWDGVAVTLWRGAKTYAGDVFYLYTLDADNANPAYPRAARGESFHGLRNWHCGPSGWTWELCSASNLTFRLADCPDNSADCRINVGVPRQYQWRQFVDTWGGMPSRWANVSLGGGAEFWSANLDGTHAWTSDPWNYHTFSRWTTDYWSVAFIVYGWGARTPP